MNTQTVQKLGQGFVWQDLGVGQQFRTFRRTIREADLVNFISCTGMLEAIFIDDHFDGAAIAGRPIPGAMTYALIEGFILQSMIQGTGLAMLELTQKIHAPVLVGDTIDALIEVVAVRPTSKGNRAVVDSTVRVFNQHGKEVMMYAAKRLLAGRSSV
jgi:3-hydroxybutyryl-CoA dehydratase